MERLTSQKGTLILQNFLLKAKKLAIITVGNPLRRDDSIGVYLGKILEKKLENVFITEQAPENFMYKVIKEDYTHVLIIDAAEIKLSPGEIGILQKEDIIEEEITTHSIPLRFYTALIKRLNKEILILGIQPKSRKIGLEISKEVRKAANSLAKRIINCVGPSIN